MPGDPGAAPVLIERVGHTLVVTLNRASAMNAVNHELATALGAAIERASADEAAWAVVLTGAGGRAFSAGADLKAMSDGRLITAAGHDEWGFAGFVNHFTPKPLIAAVDGVALGGGAELCLACDIVVATRRSRFGFPEVRRGLVAGGGAPMRLPARLPRSAALAMLLTGDDLDANRAAELGLVNEVVEDGKALERALEIAASICANAPLAVQATKRLAVGPDAPGAAAEAAWWRRALAVRAEIGSTEDAAEGRRAFAEKRAPGWSAR